MPASEQLSADLSGYSAVLKRQVWVILLVALGVTWAGAAFTFSQHPVYRSELPLVIEIPPSDLNANTVQQDVQRASVQLKGGALLSKVNNDLSGKGLTISSSKLHVVTRPDSAVMLVQYDNINPMDGITVLNSVGRAFKNLYDQPSAPASGAPSSPSPKVGARPTISPSPTPASSRTGALLPDTDSVGNGAHSIGKVEPKPVRNVVIAAALGLLLGVVAGLIREQFDDTIRGTEEAEEAFGQPATVTLPSRFLGHRPFAGPRRKGADPVVAELAIQRLAAEILWSPESRDTRTLLVTSAHPEEGKTTVTANLAVEMASSGYRVIVVEADLRRPMLHGYLDVDPSAGEVGVDAVLRGRATVTSTMVEVPVWNRSAPRSRASGQSTEGAGRLRAILSAPGHTWPSEVGAERIGEFLNVLKSRADYVIFDAPPILVVPDAYSLVNAVDTVVVVVRNDRSTMKATEAMRRLLERLRPRRVELVVAETDEEYERSYRAYATPRASRPPRSAKLPAQQEEAMPRPVQPESPPPEATEPPPSEEA